METTDESIIKLTVNKFAYMIISIVLVTNTVSLTVQRVSTNAERTEYIDKANKRRIKNAITEQDYKHEIIRKDVIIQNLDQDLKEMEEDVEEWMVKYNELKERCN